MAFSSTAWQMYLSSKLPFLFTSGSSTNSLTRLYNLTVPTMDGTTRKASKQSEADKDLEASWRNAKDDSNKLRELHQSHDQKLLKVAARVAYPTEMDGLLNAALPADPKAEQVVLEHSALSGNAALFRWMLQHRMSEPDLASTMLRLHAVRGGTAIWRELLAYNHDCINWDIGEHGDALGQAVKERDAALVRLLLEESAGVKESNCAGLPVLQAAKGMNAGDEIVDLLESYGAPE